MVYAKTGQSQSASFINQGNHETLLTITNQGVVGVHQWLPYSRSKSKPFTFNVDAVSRYKERVVFPEYRSQYVTFR